MKEKTQNIITWTIFLGVIGALVFWLGGRDNTQNKDINPDNYGSETTEKTEEAVNDFVSEYGAQTIFEDDIDYTFQLQSKLTGTSSPLAFTASLDDIYRDEGSYFFKFSPHILGPNDSHNLYYTLQGCSERVDHVLNKHAGFGRYAVVARIKEIKTPTLTIDSEPDGPDESYLEIDSSQARLASGTCLDLKYIEGSSIFGTSSKESLLNN